MAYCLCPKYRCQGKYNPVCGHNDVTYSSICELQKTECVQGSFIGIKHFRPCPVTIQSNQQSVHGWDIDPLINSNNNKLLSLLLIIMLLFLQNVLTMVKYIYQMILLIIMTLVLMCML